ncbi:MAG TPA: hypothetical protein PKM25_01350 [Candidatus Ozemobacteraceae bacterium]|nr:hypothetical protein [Candidatus Ozemobacteraceae bacterium]
MGVVIPLFRKKDATGDLPLSPDQRMRVTLLTNSIEALRKEEKSLEDSITKKCREEIDRLNAVDFRIRQYEVEIEQLCMQGAINSAPNKA